MLKEKLQVFLRISLVVDLVITVLSFILAYYLRKVLPGGIWSFEIVQELLFYIIPIWVILLLYERAYDVLGTRNIYFSSFKAIVEGMFILLAILFFRHALIQSRIFLVLFGVINILLILIARRVGISLLGEQSVFIVGSGEKAKLFYDFLSHHSPLKFKLIGSLNVKNIGNLEEIEHTIVESSTSWVVSVIDNSNFNSRLYEFCNHIGVPVSWPFPATNARVDVESYAGISFFTFSTAPKLTLVLTLKYLTDRITAFFLLLLTLPLFIVLAVLVKISSKGSVFFIQERAGLHGKPFKFFKFRTMVSGAHFKQKEITSLNIMSGVVFKVPNDPRVTRLGRLLRQLSLDELPQLINVLKGEMSLVGPRPPLPSEVREYKKWQRRRLSMKPGLTCIWQISGRNEIDFEEWMNLDLEYIDNWSLLLDFKLLCRTIPAMISRKGAY